MQKSLNTPEHQRLLAWLKKARLEQQLTMRDLAAALDTPHSFICKVEQGERRLDVIEYLRYCKALNLDPAIGLHEIQKK